MAASLPSVAAFWECFGVSSPAASTTHLLRQKGTAMQIKVLGPLEIHASGQQITPTAAKLRQLLTLLALHGGEVVSSRTLIEELWGTTPPETPQQTLQTYILHLRRRIGDALGVPKAEVAKGVLVTRHTGYSLRIAPENVDAVVYERLVKRGRQAMELGDYAAAAEMLHGALDMWRGPALVDVHTGPPLAAHVNRLEESRLGALEDRIDAELWLGRHRLVLSELAELTAQYPMNERLCAQFMIAQYRSGRGWRALEIFWNLRCTMVEELGLEPSISIQRLQRAILNSDENLQHAHTSGELLSVVAS